LKSDYKNDGEFEAATFEEVYDLGIMLHNMMNPKWKASQFADEAWVIKDYPHPAEPGRDSEDTNPANSPQLARLLCVLLKASSKGRITMLALKARLEVEAVDMTNRLSRSLPNFELYLNRAWEDNGWLS
jgi:hypothetical protein